VARKAGEECERTLAITGPGATFSLCPIVHHPRKVITTFTTFNCCPTWQEFDTVPNVPTLPALSQKMTRGSPPLPPYNVTSASTTLSSWFLHGCLRPWQKEWKLQKAQAFELPPGETGV
jgi:hypothetical protein